MESLFNKVAGLKPKTPTQVFSCEIRKIFKNNFFYRTVLVAAPANRDQQNNQVHEKLIASSLLNVVLSIIKEKPTKNTKPKQILQYNISITRQNNLAVLDILSTVVMSGNQQPISFTLDNRAEKTLI